MTDAPEKICVGPDSKHGWLHGHASSVLASECGVTYIREDIHSSAIMAERLSKDVELGDHKATIAELVEALERTAGELEDDVVGKYPLDMLVYPHNQQKLANDLEAVTLAWTALAKAKAEQ